MHEQTSSKLCPDCAETVKVEARVCRFCGYRFDLAGPASKDVPRPGGTTGKHRGFFYWAMASAALMAVGSFGPWIGALGSSVAGTDGSNDGWIVVIAAVIGALCVSMTKSYRGGGL